MDVSLTFSTGASAVQGRLVMVEVRVSATVDPVGKVEVWGYQQPGVSPTGEIGWAKIGEVLGSWGSFGWDTTQWAVGNHAIAVLVYNQLGGLYATWNPANISVREYSQLLSFNVLAIPKTVAGPAPTDGIPPDMRVPFPTDLEQAMPWVLAAGAALGVWYFFLRGQE